MAAPKFSKRRKLARNKKKSWRGIDITTTEDFLEDERFQLRTTGLVAEKRDDQLFHVERAGRDDSTDVKAPKRRRGKTELKSYSNLVNTSRIRCPRKEYPVAADFESKAVHKQTRSLKRASRNTASLKAKAKDQQIKDPQDLWGEGKETDGDDFFNEVTKRKRVQVPKHSRRVTSSRPAVEFPHPGASVNPCYDDHQDLLLEAHMVEMKKEKGERRVYNALDAKFPCVSEAPTEATWIKEMSGGLFEERNQSDEDDIADEKHISINPPVSREKKKTPKERRKQKAAKLLQQRMEQEKTVKKRENKVFSVAKIRSELAKERKQMKEKSIQRVELLEQKKLLPKKLGKTKVVAPDLELNLSTDLAGNLRGVKPEGNLLEDRYKSLQLRNIVEPRSKVNKKKTKTKKFEKKSFREVTV